MKESKNKCSKVSACNLGTALGLTWGLSLFVLVGLSMSAAVGVPLIKSLGSLYFGYHANLTGAFVGLAWGFVHGFVTGAIISAIYNYCSSCCPCGPCKNNRCST